MRLICPRCGAQYEIDGAAIPPGGRDVQCSACDHVWRAMPAAEPFDPAARPELSRPLSESVIEILREEAARELENRAAERRTRRAAERAAAIAEGLEAEASHDGADHRDTEETGATLPESHGEAAATPSEARVPRRAPPLDAAPGQALHDDHDDLRTGPGPEPVPVRPAPPPPVSAEPLPEAAPRVREPDRHVPRPARRARGRGGYLAGFAVAVMIAVLAVALYAAAPRAADEGALGVTLADWRAEVDRGRDWLAGLAGGDE